MDICTEGGAIAGQWMKQRLQLYVFQSLENSGPTVVGIKDVVQAHYYYDCTQQFVNDGHQRVQSKLMYKNKDVLQFEILNLLTVSIKIIFI